MKRHERLLDDYEDALFALLLEPVAEQESTEALELKVRLKDDPAAAVPAEVTRGSLRTIHQEFARQRRKHILKTAKRAFNHVAVFFLVSTLCFASAYALVPSVRVKTLNLMIEISEIATNLTFGEKTVPQEVRSASDDRTLAGYQMPEIPEEYTVIKSEVTSRGAYIAYENEAGSILSFRVEQIGRDGSNIDTEGAIVENIQIHGYDGLFVEKDQRMQVVWGDTDQGNLIGILASDISKEEILSYAQAMISTESSH